MKKNYLIQAGMLGFLALAFFSNPVDASLVLHYDFEETSGASVIDKSINGNNLNYFGGGTIDQTVAGKFGSGVYFGGNAGASAPAGTLANLKALTSNQITISLWAHPDAESNGGVASTIFALNNPTAGRFAMSHLEWTNGIIYWDVDTAAASDYERIQVSGGTTADDYHHYVYTYDGNTGQMVLYKDNAVLTSAFRTPGPLDWSSITGFSLSGQYRGMMDDFALFDHVLSAGDRTVAFTQGISAIVPEPTTALALCGLVAGAFFRRGRRVVK